jgi:menaquinone-specific isochorismate synthase
LAVVSTAASLVPSPVRSVPVADPGDLVARLPREGPLAWIRRGEGIVGWGEAARIELTGPDRFAAADAWWQELSATFAVRDEVRRPGSGPVALGSFSFDDDGVSVLVVPEVVLGRRGGQAWVTTVGDATALQSVAPPRAPMGVTYAEGALSAVGWEKVVAEAVERIGAGELEKVVLARDLLAVAREPLDPRWLLSRLAGRYPGCWTFSVDGMLGATPEMLVRLEQGLVTSRVLAGTIRRTGDDAHDLALAASLARSSKDLEEHEYAVRSVAEALAPHCTGMNVPESPFVLHLPNVMHLATDVAGVRAAGTSALGLAAALHPTAAVCGTPTPVARALIRQIECMDRARYAGPVGWVDAAGDGEWGIALRCAEVDPADGRRVRLFAGCGIVAGSDPEAELAESQAKLVPMRDALDG